MYDRVADLPLQIETVDAIRHERDTTSGFTRVSTEIVLRGEGVVGRGEDVNYDAVDHDRFDPAALPLTGEYTLDSFSSALDDVELFSAPPEHEASRHYRRWATESAALDLALHQGETTLGSVLDRSVEPVRFVVSTSLSDPESDEGPSIAPVHRLLEHDSDLEFKLDPTPAWDDDLIAELASTGAVRVVDLKSHYEGTGVDNPADPALYERVISGFPDAIVEDARVTDETRSVLAPARERLSWDYPITGIESIERLPFEPSWLNCKPSRFGTLESLFETIAYCENRGIRLYGGGQFELGVGRDHIQALAALCYPDAPNDVAPREYNEPDPGPGLKSSPLSDRTWPPT